ncbi:MAG: 16S rRNA (cytidine(1402)-2'-O)-methyltransferase [Gammaproteobacteria bacterium]|jgi:16S rRNA (cytidine1402-2'-O)-methyltransferase|nr:16S rRNA (cytidine(1402)-2'-O)-methyltransferase [Gammaproteobacteria bacterium]MDP6974528.1 16S rRNA (cytidine(1402)-2'-O)-methyltransferase [Gammaproteobacteria bacterium]
MQGTLFIVATPIGNLDDITFRAVETLKVVDLVLAEDTRHSQKVLNHFNIKTPISAFHDYNEREKCNSVIDKLKQGDSIALISDAGTPLISDPGYVLVSVAKKNSVNVVPVPGPSALIAALSASGIPSDSFSFFGFLPSKQNARIKTLKMFASRPETIIVYESPKRISNTLADMLFVFGKDREVCLAKEITKTFETILTTNIPSLIDYISSDPSHQKGEFVILISSTAKKGKLEFDQQLDKLLPVLCSEMGPSKAAKLATKITGIDKRYCYQRAIEL